MRISDFGSSTSPAEPLQDAEHYRRQLEIVATNATLALFIMDEHQHCTYMNPAAEMLTGFTLAEVQGRALHDIIHHTRPDGSHYPLEECPIDRAFPQNMQEQGEEVFVHRDGSFYPVAFTASPIREGHRTVGTIIEVRDIRKEKEQEQAIREKTHVLETINRVNATLAAELDLEKLVQTVTDAGTELTGAQFGAFFYNVIGRQGEAYMLYSLSGVPREAFSKFPMPRNTPIFHPTFSGEGVVRSDDITEDPRYGQMPPHYGMPKGHLPVRSYLAVPVIARTGDVLGGLFFGHEQPGVFSERAEHVIAGIASQAAIAIENARLFETAQAELAERRLAEAKLKELNETLEQRVAERTAELERLNTELTRSNRELQEFAYVASHDLQEPLRKISSYAELMAEEYAGTLDDTARHYLERMQVAALRMLGLIRDLLSFSRITTGAQPLTRVDLNAILAEVLSDLEVTIREIGGTIEVADLPSIEADGTQMRQLFQNLVGNALKFHRPGVAPVIRVACVSGADEHQNGPETRGACRIVVEDNGIGFDEKYLDRIFAPFQRLHGQEAYAGTGIGLAICRRIVERHGGSISARSTPGEGSVFVITLPVRRAGPAERTTERSHDE